jgi:hypothetical protein
VVTVSLLKDRGAGGCGTVECGPVFGAGPNEQDGIIVAERLPPAPVSFDP